MSELRLPVCPICGATASLSRRTLDRQGESWLWYECQECGSVLLSLGDDQWAYQKVMRDDKAYLLKQPMTASELLDLVTEPESDLSLASAEEAEANVWLQDWSSAGESSLPGDVETSPVDTLRQGWSRAEVKLSPISPEAVGADTWLQDWSQVEEDLPESELSGTGDVLHDWSQIGDGVPDLPLGREGAAQPAKRDGAQPIFRRVILGLLVLCLLSFLVVIVMVAYQVLTGSPLF
jgi:hypothetical protein